MICSVRHQITAAGPGVGLASGIKAVSLDPQNEMIFAQKSIAAL